MKKLILSFLLVSSLAQAGDIALYRAERAFDRELFQMTMACPVHHWFTLMHNQRMHLFYGDSAIHRYFQAPEYLTFYTTRPIPTVRQVVGRLLRPMYRTQNTVLFPATETARAVKLYSYLRSTTTALIQSQFDISNSIPEEIRSSSEAEFIAGHIEYLARENRDLALGTGPLIFGSQFANRYYGLSNEAKLNFLKIIYRVQNSDFYNSSRYYRAMLTLNREPVDTADRSLKNFIIQTALVMDFSATEALARVKGFTTSGLINPSYIRTENNSLDLDEAALSALNTEIETLRSNAQCEIPILQQTQAPVTQE